MAAMPPRRAALRPARAAAPPRRRPLPAPRRAAPLPPPPPSRRPRRAAVTVAAPAAAAAAAAQPAPDAPAYDPRAFARTVAPTALTLALCNMDRMCLSVAMLPLAAEAGWAPSVQGLVQSAFLWGYLANQLAGGAAADRFGGKRVMAFGIAAFSAASALLPAAAAHSLGAVLAARAAVGLGEGVALPAMSNLVATRIAPRARATALGLVFAGFQAGNLLGLALSPMIIQRYGWRALFYMFAALGAPTLALWAWAVPPPPSGGAIGNGNNSNAPAAAVASTSSAASASASSSSAATAEKEKAKVTLGALLRSRAVRAIIAANMVNHWGYFIYLNWMPTFFATALGGSE
jgi:MFS family permease